MKPRILSVGFRFRRGFPFSNLDRARAGFAVCTGCDGIWERQGRRESRPWGIRAHNRPPRGPLAIIDDSQQPRVTRGEGDGPPSTCQRGLPQGEEWRRDRSGFAPR